MPSHASPDGAAASPSWAALRRRTGTTARALARRGSRLRGAYALLAAELPRRDALARALASGGTLALEPVELALAQYEDGACRRLDLFVRLLAIEEWAGGSPGGVELYCRFVARKSAAQGRSAPSHTVEDFLGLVADVERRGLDRSHPVVIQPDRWLLDGLHRFAAALFFGLRPVPVAVAPAGGPRADYGVERLRALGLTAADVDAVLAAEARYRAAWPSAAAARGEGP